MKIILFFFLLIPSLCLAGGWTQKRGGYYAKLSFSSFLTEEQFGIAGARQPLNSQFSNLRNAQFSDNSFYFYGEYGLVDWGTFILNTSYKNFSSTGFNSDLRQNYEHRARGPGDVYLGARWRLLALPFAVAVQPMMKIPVADESTVIPLGTGAKDYEVRLQIGAKAPLPVQNYFTADVGYTWRGGEAFHDEIPYFAEFGVWAGAEVIVKVSLDGRKSARALEAANPADSGNMNVLIQDQNFTRLWGGVIYHVSRKVQLSLEASHVLSGKNTVAGRTIYVGMALASP